MILAALTLSSTLTPLPQALNQLFEKIMALDIEERHLLRLGHGEEALETEKDFSRCVTQLLRDWVLMDKCLTISIERS